MNEKRDVLEKWKKEAKLGRRKMIKEMVAAFLYFYIFYGLLVLSFILFFLNVIDTSILLLFAIIWTVGHIIADLGDSIHTHTSSILELLVEQNEILRSMKVDSNN